MKKFKRTASLLLALLTALAASCGTKPSNYPETTTDTEPRTEEITETAPAEYAKPDVDYGGETFTILDYDTNEYFWQAATYSDIRAEEQSGDPINDAQYKRNRKVEEELNITLETYPVGGSGRNENQNVFRKLVMAQENEIDAGFVFGSYVGTLLDTKGLTLDWNTIPGIDLDASWWDQNARETFTFGDQLKVLTGDISLYSQFAPMLLYFNKNVADSFGIDDCYDLVRDGKWTADKVREYCELVAGDLNGDNVMDENDRCGMALQSAIIFDMFMSSDLHLTERNSDGGLDLTVMSDRSVELQKRFYDFVTNKALCCNAVGYQTKYSNPFYELHIPMFKNGQLLFNFNQLLISFELRSMEADYGLLPTPKADETQKDYCTSMNMSWQTFLAIPATNNRLQMTGDVIEALGYYSKEYVTNEFIDTTIRSKAIRDEDSAEMLEIILAHKTYDAAMIYKWGGLTDVILQQNFASKYASAESRILKEMKKTLDTLE